jgi:hypothetical protein
MHQIENKREDAAESSTAGARKKVKSQGTTGAVGVASTFDSKGLNTFFVNYLTTMLVIEGLIFFFCFINHLATDSAEFPWKNYLFATFIAPIAITFVFGLIILTFNKYFFKGAVEAADPYAGSYAGRLKKGDRLEAFFQVVHRLPFLFSLLLLIAATAVAYKLDDIVIYAAQAGATTAKYLFITLIGVMAVVALGLGIWMILSYRLRQKSLASEHQYRMQLMDQFGMVLLDDGTMLNKDGNVIYQQEGANYLEYEDEDEEVQLIEEVKQDQ